MELNAQEDIVVQTLHDERFQSSVRTSLRNIQYSGQQVGMFSLDISGIPGVIRDALYARFPTVMIPSENCGILAVNQMERPRSDRNAHLVAQTFRLKIYHKVSSNSS